MSLIKCKYCERDVSSEAAVCLNCGNLIDSEIESDENKESFSKLGSTIAIILIFIIAFILIMISLSFDNSLFALFIGVIMFFIILHMGVNMANK